MSNQKHIVLAGGGTAGHVNPLLAVAHVIRELEPEADIAVVGTAVGLERDLVPQAGFELETIEKVPFPRRPNKAALQFPAKWKAEKAKVRDILTRHQAQVVVGFGGYTSAPVYAAAHSMGIPIAIHEQNARAGMANKLGARWASMIGAAYAQPGLKPRRGVEVERVGHLVRAGAWGAGVDGDGVVHRRILGCGEREQGCGRFRQGSACARPGDSSDR